MKNAKREERRRAAADDGKTENNYKNPEGGSGKACWLVYRQKKYWLYKPIDRRTTEDGG